VVEFKSIEGMELSPIEQIKERLDIVEVVSEYLKLEKTGQNFRALCPFHSEKKPSFFVSPARQIFKCFGCGESGDIFKFIMKIEGVEFGDALRILAQKAGVELKPFKKELKTERARLYDICELACRFFEKQLWESSEGNKVKNYLQKRGLKEETIKKWRLGYAPDVWRGLSDFLVGKGFKREEIVKAGLAVESEKSQLPYDRFRGRIIFPIFDTQSQVIGFGGRIFKESEKEDVAKYINIPNTPLYDKSRVLYGLNFAKLEIKKKDFCILVEGYMDVILSHQAGFQNTVAASGTSLTTHQLNILKRYTSNLLSAFDMDKAGNLATERSIGLAQKEDFQVKVIKMPQDKDPADVICADPAKWEKLVKNSQEVMEFYFERTFSEFDKNTIEGKRKIAQALLPKIKQISNKILQSFWIQKLAKELEVKEEVIVQEMKKVKSFSEENISETREESPSFLTQPSTKTRKDLIEEELLSLLIQSPQQLEKISEEDFSVFSPRLKIILTHFQKEKKGKDFISQETIEKIGQSDEKIKEILYTASLRAEIEKRGDIEENIQNCLKELKKLSVQQLLKDISLKIQQAEKEGDEKKMKNLIEKFNQAAKILTTFQKNEKSQIEV